MHGRYHDVSINPSNAAVQQLYVKNKNCLLTEVPVRLTVTVTISRQFVCQTLIDKHKPLLRLHYIITVFLRRIIV